jgi:hypothetical protein
MRPEAVAWLKRWCSGPCSKLMEVAPRVIVAGAL